MYGLNVPNKSNNTTVAVAAAAAVEVAAATKTAVASEHVSPFNIVAILMHFFSSFESMFVFLLQCDMTMRTDRREKKIKTSANFSR